MYVCVVMYVYMYACMHVKGCAYYIFTDNYFTANYFIIISSSSSSSGSGSVAGGGGGDCGFGCGGSKNRKGF